jgi:hypothetical protein
VKELVYEPDTMSDEEIVVISSSPEPEYFTPAHRGKGKSRATNDVLVDLTFDDEMVEFEEYEDGPIASGSALDTCVDGGNNLDGKTRDSPLTTHEPERSAARQEEPQGPEDPVERAIWQVLNVIPNVDPEHLRALVLGFESQSEEIDVRLLTTTRITDSDSVCCRSVLLSYHNFWRIRIIPRSNL